MMSSKIEKMTISNDSGMEVTCLNYGAILHSIRVPLSGAKVPNSIGANVKQKTEVLIKPKRLESYLTQDNYMGTIVGRFCNRIENSNFEIDGKPNLIDSNEGTNCLHGGSDGLNKKFWNVEKNGNGSSNEIIMSCESADGENGFPGNLKVQVVYGVTNDNKVTIDISATTDRQTPVNLTGHAYFNLNLSNDSTIKQHQLQVAADHFLPIKSDGIPLLETREVINTDFDFRRQQSLEKLLLSDDEQIISNNGIDHNFVLAQSHHSKSSEGGHQLPLGELVKAASLYSSSSNITMTLWTNKPGLQIYTGNHLGGEFKAHQGICLEPQFFPNTPNRPDYPNCLLKPGELYRHKMVYQFDDE